MNNGKKGFELKQKSPQLSKPTETYIQQHRSDDEGTLMLLLRLLEQLVVIRLGRDGWRPCLPGEVGVGQQERRFEVGKQHRIFDWEGRNVEIPEAPGKGREVPQQGRMLKA